jgi:single-strand DNA-binding protein
MKNLKNSFEISGYVGFTEIRSFEKNNVCRFSLAISNKNKEEKTTAFLYAEAWRRELKYLEPIEKGKLITISGYFKPEEWTDSDGQKHNRTVLVAKTFAIVENEE